MLPVAAEPLESRFQETIFLQVLDKQTLGIAEFAGNRQYITLGNLSEHPRAFVFLIDHIQSPVPG